MSQAEYREFRCCMCPNIATPQVSLCTCGRPCRFVKAYRDKRGWVYAALPGIGHEEFKAKYQKPGKIGWKGVTQLPWRTTFDQAQEDLNKLAKQKGWEEA